MAIAMPVGMTVRSPALRTTSFSVQAQISSPALPEVARFVLLRRGALFSS
jgi:hypothetical protein